MAVNGSCAPDLENPTHTDDASEVQGLGLNRAKIPFVYCSMIWGTHMVYVQFTGLAGF